MLVRCMASPAIPSGHGSQGTHSVALMKGQQRALPLCYVITGVSGSGKSTVGKLLANEMGCQFFDGDDFHPQSNIEKMRHRVPLTDDDRDPWLRTLGRVLEEHVVASKQCVLACSCLKVKYRHLMLCGADCERHRIHLGDVAFVLLRPSREELVRRVAARKAGGGHFMPPELLDSQLASLEIDPDAQVFDTSSPEEIVKAILANRRAAEEMRD